jgi:hypothetical protein
MNEFGFAGTSFDFTEPDQIIQLGGVPDRIDLLTGITGVATDEALQTKIATHLDELPVFILSKALLIQNKRAVARPQDLADLDTLS